MTLEQDSDSPAGPADGSRVDVDVTDLADLERELSRLERNGRWLRGALLAAGLVGGLVLLAAADGDQPAVEDAVTAERIVVVDADGKPRIAFQAGAETPSVTVYPFGEESHPYLQLTAGEQEASVRMVGTKSSLNLTSAARGGSFVSLDDEQGTARVLVGYDARGDQATFEIFDREGTARWNKP
jgi:hypothetical protein